MKFSEKLEQIYDSLICDISFCSDVKEIMDTINETFNELIDFEKRREHGNI